MTDRPSTTEVDEHDMEARWRAQITKELRGRTLESLVQPSEDGFDVRPLYVGRHLEELDCLDSLPGKGLNARGFEDASGGSWKNCPELGVENPEMMEAQALEASALGADMAWCCCVPTDSMPGARGSSGLRRLPLRSFAKSLRRIVDANLPLVVEAGAVASPIAAAMEQNGGDFSGVSLTIDTVGGWASRGVAGASGALMDEELRACLTWARDREPTAVRLLCATQPFHDAGASPAQELGIAMSLVVSTLRRVEDAGADFEQVLSSLLVRVAIGRDLFTEIAKLRALRSLWSQVMGACGFGTVHRSVEVAVKGSWRDRTAVDPWVNLLRGTTESFAAAAGGASMVTTVPMHEAIGGDSAMARRLATNTQVLLRRESHLGRVMDVAGGSYYVEWLTNSLALEGWKWFQRIEASGGVEGALRTNAMHRWLEERCAQREAAVARRDYAIVGVSDFPATTSTLPPDHCAASSSRRSASTNQIIPRWSRNRPITSRASVLEDATFGNAWDALADTAANEPRGTPLPRVRLSESFEELRAQASRLPRPLEITVVHVGSGGVVQARADFAANVIGILGVAVVQDSIENFLQRPGLDADVAVLCASDHVLEERLVELVAQARAARARRVVVAAPPRSLGEGGPDAFLHQGADIRAFLESLLGAARTHMDGGVR